MLIDSHRHSVFAYVTEDQPEAMNQALRLAFLIEKDILNSPQPFSEKLSIQNLLDKYAISRSVGHEAIRILQHRKVVQTKRGPAGGVQVVPQSDANLKAALKRYLLQRGLAPERCSQARESLQFISAKLAPGNPACALATLALETLDEMQRDDAGAGSHDLASQTLLRADQVASAILLKCGVSAADLHARIGHEDILSERFRVSKPVIRQAIRILEAESIVETRRGRGCGIYFTSAHAGPVARLLAMWLLGRNATFPQVFEFEHPLRVAIAMQAARNQMPEPAQQALLELQAQMEGDSKVQLVDIINMERRVSRVADNYLLAVLLKSITVYKISRAQYQEYAMSASTSYAALNRQFLQGLFTHRELQIENFCQEKNHFLMSYDMNSMLAH
jgi:DNA-binding FadR family transcriptional regulator